MLKKIFMTAMTLVLFFQQTAFAGSGLSEALDELQFALTVEWDQKDQNFYDRSIQKFQDKLSLLEAQGQDRTKMFEEVISKVKSESFRSDMRLMTNLVATKIMSEKDAMNFIQDSVKKTYSSGASWNGESWLRIGGIIIVVGFMAFWITGMSKCLNDPNSVTSCSGGVTCYDGDDCYADGVCGCSYSP